MTGKECANWRYAWRNCEGCNSELREANAARGYQLAQSPQAIASRSHYTQAASRQPESSSMARRRSRSPERQPTQPPAGPTIANLSSNLGASPPVARRDSDSRRREIPGMSAGTNQPVEAVRDSSSGSASYRQRTPPRQRSPLEPSPETVPAVGQGSNTASSRQPSLLPACPLSPSPRLRFPRLPGERQSGYVERVVETGWWSQEEASEDWEFWEREVRDARD